ncbi:MAG: beta-lactamase family protein [Fuerstiella sp.]|nr:beta-lactamase family protein [Fuerstiella sp.]
MFLTLLLVVSVIGLVSGRTSLVAAPPEVSETEQPADYFPPPESEGGWRSLLPSDGVPTATQKQTIRDKAGIDWDALQSVWEYTRLAGGNSGFLVIRRGYIVGEWYHGCDRSATYNLYSSSKSYTTAAFGILLGDVRAGRRSGYEDLNLETKVFNSRYLPEALPLTDPRKADITLRHLLSMTAGFAAQSPPKTMPFEWTFGGVDESPMAQLAADPGTKFYYSNGGAAHLLPLFHRIAGQDLFPFLNERMFVPIGLRNIRWLQLGGNQDIGPYSQGYSGVLTTAREHARFCHLALHRGRWDGEEIVPKEYYDFAWQPTDPYPEYGGMWWIYHVPERVVWTRGARKNNGFVVPDQDLIFVRVGDATSDKFPEDFGRHLATKVVATITD